MIKNSTHFQNFIIAVMLICSNFLAAITVIQNKNSTIRSVQDFNKTSPLLLNEVSLLEESTLEPSVPTNPEPDETFDFTSSLIIKAINPGYKVNEQNDVGEFIELQNLSDAPILLAGVSLRYTNGSGKKITLLNFPEDSFLTGEYLLARYKKSPDAEQSDITYATSLALTTGPLELVFGDEVVDTICWTGKTGCASSFKSADPTTLVRNLSTGEFTHLPSYDAHYDVTSENLILPEPPDPVADETDNNKSPQCPTLEFSEIFTYYTDEASEQFIEFFNHGNQTVHLDGCAIRYKKKSYQLSGEVPAQSYFAYYPHESFSLTKNPTTSNQIELIDADGQVVDELVYQHGQKKSMSYAKFYDASGVETWAQTYALTPGAANNFQEQRTCPVGKTINPLTGNCVNVTSVNNSATECPAGKYRNPLTGRCKNISSTSSTKECAEGYERNPETNRCRKIKTENQGTDFALVPSTSTSKTTFAAFGAVILLVSLGVLYVVWQFRHEITRACRKTRQSFHHLLKHGFTRKGCRDGDKET